MALPLLSQIDRLWPGAIADVKKFREAHPDLEPPQPIVHSKPLERARLAAFLLHAPNPYTDARFVDSIPGLSPLLAARYTTALGTVCRFPSPGHIWSFAGFDPLAGGKGQ